MNVKAADTSGISEREAEVLEAVGSHLSNAQIAGRLHISVRTVESHVSSLLRKFGVADRRTLAELAPTVTARQQAGPGVVTGLQPARTSFVGRQRELATVLGALPGSRLVTLLGPGGVGKTRLVTRVAELAAGSYPFGTVFVDLVPVREGFVTQAVAALLGVTERPGRSLDAALHEYLGRGPLLLVLDNCEHLLEVVTPFIEKLLADCADLTVLTTSRERLGIPGERAIGVPPLPHGVEGVSEAEALFLDRALAMDPDFTAPPGVVSEVCARLDGVPLAIELAAARSASLGIDGLLDALEDHLRLLVGSRGAQGRHRSLRAVIDWSHELLDADERALFRRLGVFLGGFDVSAAAAVCPEASRGMVADLIGRLTDKSLLIHRRGGDGSRWQMLETIRAYALDQLSGSDEEDWVREAHLRWAAATATALEARLPQEGPWRPAFDAVADDLRAAALAASPSPQTGEVSHELARALGHLTYARRFLHESRKHYQVAAEHARHAADAARDLRSAADAAMAEGHGSAAFELLLAAAERAAQAGDSSAQAAALAYAATIADRFADNFRAEIPPERRRALAAEAARIAPAGDPVSAAYVAAAAAWAGRPEKAVPSPALAAEALVAARATGDPVLISGALDGVVVGLDTGGRLREAHQVTRERAALLGCLARHDPRAAAEIIDTFHMVTEIAITAGDLPGALSNARLAERDDIAAGQPHMAASKSILPLVLQGRFDEAAVQGNGMWESWMRAGQPPARWMAPAAYAVVLAHGLRGDEDGCREWLGRVSALAGTGAHRDSGTNLASCAAFSDARVALHRGRCGDAMAAVASLPIESEPWYGTPQWHSLRPYAWAIAAEVAVVASLAEPSLRDEAAARLATVSPAGDENHWAAACLARAAGRLYGDEAALARSVAEWERISARFERACTLTLIPGRAAEGLAELAALGCQPPAW